VEAGPLNKSPQPLSVDLVIFDCDGVLVDSEVISCRAPAEVLSRHGYLITEQQVLERFLGVSDREARAIIEASAAVFRWILKRR
jgi:beta-phosphoglucomutase-like phosphatase (HAD superfamily)